MMLIGHQRVGIEACSFLDISAEEIACRRASCRHFGIIKSAFKRLDHTSLELHSVSKHGAVETWIPALIWSRRVEGRIVTFPSRTGKSDLVASCCLEGIHKIL